MARIDFTTKPQTLVVVLNLFSLCLHIRGGGACRFRSTNEAVLTNDRESPSGLGMVP